MSPPVYVLLAGVVIEIVAGGFAFLSNVLVLALALCMVGMICLGVAGDALRAR
jgi:hypothetical protein